MNVKILITVVLVAFIAGGLIWLNLRNRKK